MKTFIKESFEDFLERMHMEDEPMTLDDELPDTYDNWVSNLGVDLFIAYAEKWHAEQLLAYFEIKCNSQSHSTE